MDVKKCTVCNIRRGKDKSKKIELYLNTVRAKIEKKYNNNNKEKIQVVNSVNDTNIDKKEREVVDSVKNNNNRTLIIGFLICGETYRMNQILLPKQEPIFIITKSLNQYPEMKAQISDEIEPLEQYENSTVVFDDKLLSKQESNIDLFLLEDATLILICIIFLKAIFISQKKLFVRILIKLFYSNKL